MNQGLLNMLLPSDYPLSETAPSSSGSSSSSSSSDPVPDAMTSALTQDAFIGRLGRAGANSIQIEQVLRNQGNLIHYKNSDEATLNLATMLDQLHPDRFANISYFVSRVRFIEAFSSVFAQLPVRPFIASLLDNQWYDRADVADLIIAMGSDPGLCVSIKALHNNGMSYSTLLKLAQTPDLYSTVKFLTRYELYDFKLTQIGAQDCKNALNEAEQYLNTFPLIGTNEHPYIADALRQVIHYFNNDITPENALAHLLQPREYGSEASFNLQLSFSKHLYLTMKQFELAAGLAVNAHFPLDEKNNWLNSVIQAMPGREAINLYHEVFTYAMEVDNLPVLSQGQLATTLEALGVCRRNHVSPQALPLAELFQNTLLAKRLVTFAGTDYLERFIAVGRHIRLDVLVALDRLEQHKMPEDCYRLAMKDSPKAHAFRCLLNRASDEGSMRMIYNVCRANRRTNISQHADNHINLQLSDAECRANAVVINEAELLCGVRQLHPGNPDNFADMARLFTSDSEQGERFRRALALVDSSCNEIARYLREAAPHSAKFNEYDELARSFRARLHQVAYNQLTNPHYNLDAQLTEAAAPLKEHLNVDRHPYLRRFLKGIANALLLIVSLPTGFYFNRRHKEKTGDFLFFTRARSCEMLNETVQQLPSILPPPAA